MGNKPPMFWEVEYQQRLKTCQKQHNYDRHSDKLSESGGLRGYRSQTFTSIDDSDVMFLVSDVKDLRISGIHLMRKLKEPVCLFVFAKAKEVPDVSIVHSRPSFM
ncbi:MAG: hypothetical protein IMF19_14290 [Proteobacteria bacterium]|nr:hypothetical protein [Pseudomonadota bacterium]